jgi:hypothetical protein
MTPHVRLLACDFEKWNEVHVVGIESFFGAICVVQNSKGPAVYLLLYVVSRREMENVVGLASFERFGYLSLLVGIRFRWCSNVMRCRLDGIIIIGFRLPQGVALERGPDNSYKAM